MRVFVTGASGFVGKAVVRLLRTKGHTVRALLRRTPPSARGDSGPGDLEFHAGNVLQPQTLVGAADAMDAVIHLVGIISEVAESTFENIHMRGTLNVVALAKNSGVRRFIQMSALGTRQNAVSRYHQTKWAAEEIVRQASLDYTIFRPSLIYGPEDHFVNLFAKMIRLSPVVPVIGTGRARFQPVHVETVAAAFGGALSEPLAVGKTFDVCGPDILTLPGIIDAVLAALGRKRVKVRVPPPLARAQASLLEFFYPRLLRRAPPLNRDQLVMLEEDNLGNPEPANQLFKLEPRVFREEIVTYLRAGGSRTQTSIP